MTSPEVELYPSEITELKIIWASLQRKWGERPATQSNMKMFVDEVTSRFATELGLVVNVDSANLEFVGDSPDEMVVSPIIEIVGRVNKEDFEFERAAHEMQNGLLDGQVGMITGDSRIVEPKKYL